MNKLHIAAGASVGIIALGVIATDHITDTMAQNLIQENVIESYRDKGYEVRAGKISGSIDGMAHISNIAIRKDGQEVLLDGVRASNGYQVVEKAIITSDNNPGDSLTISNITTEGIKYKDGERQLEDNVSITIDSIDIDVEKLNERFSDSPDLNPFRDIGFAANWLYDPQANTTDLNVAISINDQAGLNLEAGLSNVSEKLLTAAPANTMDQEQALSLMNSIGFRSASIIVWNETLLETLIQTTPAFKNKSFSSVKARIVSNIQRMAYPDRYKAPVLNFIGDARELKVSLNPDEPITSEEFVHMGKALMIGQTSMDRIGDTIGFNMSN